MSAKKFQVLIAFLAVVASILACGSPGELSLTNPRMSFDEPGEQATTVYSPSDPFFAVADISNAPQGTKVSAKWYAVDVPGFEPGFLDESVLNVDEESFSGYVSFQYTYEDPGGWPPGQYKAELYLNDVLTHTMNFAVQ
jgi:hypothetical protein